MGPPHCVRVACKCLWYAWRARACAACRRHSGRIGGDSESRMYFWRRKYTWRRKHIICRLAQYIVDFRPQGLQMDIRSGCDHFKSTLHDASTECLVKKTQARGRNLGGQKTPKFEQNFVNIRHRLRTRSACSASNPDALRRAAPQARNWF